MARVDLQSTPGVLSRVAGALFGGYVFTWGGAALGMAGLVALGVSFHEAEQAVLMLAFLVFLGVFLWGMSAPVLWRVWAVLAGGGLLMTAAAWGLQRVVLGGF
jgi:hypothetical protein